MRIAIVGSGVSGLVAAHLLDPHHEITLFEADARLGGHAHPHRVIVDGVERDVDTGFIVYNERNYPILTTVFSELGVVTRPSEMSFAVSDEAANLEWSGSSIAGLFAQRRNVIRPSFWRMLLDIARFNRRATRDLERGVDPDLSLREYLARHHYSRAFREWYLIAMGSSIWSANPETFDEFPVATFLRFFSNHGLLSVRNRPQWRTIVGGSRCYVDALARRLRGSVRLGTPVSAVARRANGVTVTVPTGEELFDHVIIAAHADQALRLLDEPTALERELLSALNYQANEAALHTDERIMPRRLAARASWNWRRVPGVTEPTLSYDLSRLQGLSGRTLYLTLNQTDAIDPERILSLTTYHHPVFDRGALRAQDRYEELHRDGRISFVGAYWGYGFHEDGAASAVRACAPLLPGGA